MRRRVLGLVTSVVLAFFGTVVLVGYVQGARDKAEAGEATVAVLLVMAPIEKGAAAASLGERVAPKEVPVSTKVDGAVVSVKELEGLVAAAELVPGEQVLLQRFQTPEKLGRAGVPDGLLEVTVALDPERAVGGAVKAGDTVAVVASFKPFDPVDAGLPPGSQKTPNTSHVILHKVLVSNVQTTERKTEPKKKEEGDPDIEDAEVGPGPAPGGRLLVTLALDASAVERVVFAAEHGSLWLSAEPKDAPDGGTQIETRAVVLR